MNCARGLPAAAAVINPANPCAVVIVRREVAGYWPVRECDDEAGAVALMAAINGGLGVAAPQREAMLAGSLFGWTCPAADPQTYDARGYIVRDDWTRENDDPAPYQQ